MQDLKEVLSEIYSRIDREKLLLELKPQRKADYYLLECPSCHKKEAFLYDSGVYITCNRINNCSYSKSIWDYIQENQGFSNQETLKYLADLANYQLKNTSYDEEKYLKSKEKGNLLEKALTFMKKNLWSQRNEVIEYLESRGYSQEEIRLMDLGYFPEQKKLQEYLISEGFSNDLISTSGLNTKGMGTSHILSIPYRDSNGVLKGFIVRSLLKDKELEQINEKKYKYTYGLEKDTLFNINNAKKSKNLIIVEGYLDCLIAQVKGLKGVVGTGGNNLTDNQLDNAVKLGIKHFILALDNDKAGKSGTEKAIKKIYQKDLKVFVVKISSEFKDPDELIKDEGIDAFSEIVKKAEIGIKWLAIYLIEKHNFLATDIDREEALEEAISYAETIFEPLIAHDYLKTVTELLEIAPEFLELKFEQYKSKLQKERVKRDYQELFKEASKLVTEKDPEEIETYISGKLQDIKTGLVNKLIKPYTLEDLQLDLADTVEGLKTGYPSLDNLLSIPQEAITIVAGRPSHGKTTLLLNLYVNMIQKYPDKVFLFFSYEETKKQLTLKILNLISGHLINEKQNLYQIENYIKFNKSGIYEIEKAKEKLDQYTKNSRMWIIDEPFYVEQLVAQIAYFKERYDVGAVFIDYIQKIKIKSKYTTRQLEVQKISESILEAAKTYSLPIILGAQLGRDKDSKNKIRLDNLREAGDIENDANLVIAINNEAMDKAQSENKKLTDRTVNLKLHILKNRNGAVNEEVSMIFDRPLLKISEGNVNSNSNSSNGNKW